MSSMQPISLKCPNCGAPISSQTMRCKYCRTHLLFRDNIVALEKSYKCPECGTSIGTGSVICIGCGKVLTTDPKELNIFRAEQKRIKFLHNERLNSLPEEVRQRLEPDEYVYSIVEGKEGVKYGKKKQFIVTNKRIIVHHAGSGYTRRGLTWHKVGPEIREISYDGVVVIGSEDKVDLDFTVVVVRCFKEDENLVVSFPLFSSDAEDFATSAEIAFDNHRLQRKGIMALWCFANA